VGRIFGCSPRRVARRLSCWLARCPDERTPPKATLSWQADPRAGAGAYSSERSPVLHERARPVGATMRTCSSISPTKNSPPRRLLAARWRIRKASGRRRWRIPECGAPLRTPRCACALFESYQLLIDHRLRNRRGCRARTAQHPKCKQQAHCSRQLPVAGLRWLRVGCGAA